MYQRDFIAGLPDPSAEAAGATAPTFDSHDPRYAKARNAAIRSFLNRYGRMPTEWDIAQSLIHYLPAELRSPTQVAAEQARRGYARPVDTQPPSLERPAPDFGGDAIRWLLRQRYGRLPANHEVRRAIEAYASNGPSGQVRIDVDPESLKISRLPSHRPPPFERTPLSDVPPTFHQHYLLPILRWPNRYLPLDHVPDLPSLGGTRG